MSNLDPAQRYRDALQRLHDEQTRPPKPLALADRLQAFALAVWSLLGGVAATRLPHPRPTPKSGSGTRLPDPRWRALCRRMLLPDLEEVRCR